MFQTGQPVFVVRPEHPETIHAAVIALPPDGGDPAYAVDLPDGSRHRLMSQFIATDPAAARTIRQSALLSRADYFARKAADLRGMAA